jgi:FkbM family methyltransferase
VHVVTTRPHPPLIVRACRVVGWILGPVPGWYMLLVEPIVRRCSVVASVVDHGVRFDVCLDEFVQRKFYCRSYERRELRFVRTALRPGDVAVDVGANVGLLALAAAGAVAPSGRVLAIEPIARNVGRLEHNVALNPSLNVTVRRVAAGADSAVLHLSRSVDQIEAGNEGSFTRTSEGFGECVAQETLDSLVAAWAPDAPAIALVKIDVEGMELDVLRGARSLLDTGRVRAVMLEVNQRFTGHHQVLDELAQRDLSLRRLVSLGRLRPWRGPTRRASVAVRLGRLVPGAVGRWLSGEDRLATLVAVRADVAATRGRRRGPPRVRRIRSPDAPSGT